MIFWKPVIRIKIISEQNRFCYNYNRLQVRRREKIFDDPLKFTDVIMDWFSHGIGLWSRTKKCSPFRNVRSVCSSGLSIL